MMVGSGRDGVSRCCRRCRANNYTNLYSKYISRANDRYGDDANDAQENAVRARISDSFHSRYNYIT